MGNPSEIVQEKKKSLNLFIDRQVFISSKKLLMLNAVTDYRYVLPWKKSNFRVINVSRYPKPDFFKIKNSFMC